MYLVDDSGDREYFMRHERNNKYRLYENEGDADDDFAARIKLKIEQDDKTNNEYKMEISVPPNVNVDDAFGYLDTIIRHTDEKRADTTAGDANSYLTATSLFNRCR